jgi:hypothetical protein
MALTLRQAYNLIFLAGVGVVIVGALLLVL